MNKPTDGSETGLLTIHSNGETTTRTVTTLPGETDADACRRRGWGPGTVLIGDEGYGPSIIRITAVGERNILALSQGYESMWTLSCRDWEPFASAEAHAHG